jgi:hypothetical protein
VYTLVDVVIADITRSNVFLHLTFSHRLLTLEVSHVKERRCHNFGVHISWLFKQIDTFVCEHHACLPDGE